MRLIRSVPEYPHRLLELHLADLASSKTRSQRLLTESLLELAPRTEDRPRATRDQEEQGEDEGEEERQADGPREKVFPDTSAPTNRGPARAGRHKPEDDDDEDREDDAEDSPIGAPQRARLHTGHRQDDDEQGRHWSEEKRDHEPEQPAPPLALRQPGVISARASQPTA